VLDARVMLHCIGINKTIFCFCVLKFMCFLHVLNVCILQDVEVSGDKDDSRCLHVNVLRPTSIAGGTTAAASRAPPRPLLSARFIFDDHIRCMAARQRLVKGRLRARQRKMHMIAQLLEIPVATGTQSAGGQSRRTKPSSASSAIPGQAQACRDVHSNHP